MAHQGVVDEFVAAILVAFDPSRPPEMRAAAQAYCERIKNSSDGWKLCLQKLHQIGKQPTGRPEVKFWCLQIILTLIRTRWNALTEEERNYLRGSLMLFIRDVIPTVNQTTFIKTKLSVCLVNIIIHDFPQRWPKFFTDFFSMLDKGPEVVDMFLRVLKTIDQDIVTRDPKWGIDEQKRSAQIKDAMREKAMKGIVDAIHGVVVACHASKPELAKMALDVLGDYISWIEIGLIANERFIPMLYKFLLNPTLQHDACDCISEVVYKRMPATKKLAIINQTRIVDMLKGLDLKGTSEAFQIKIASLANTLGCQVLECRK